MLGKENPIPLVCAGGGYYYAGRHSGGLLQAEYRFGRYLFNLLRPQFVFIVPELRSLFFGLGLGIEIPAFYHFYIIPSFTPGIYLKGSGRDLGYPLEFRTSFEIAYEWKNCVRLGTQFYHISNASLSNRNPGANALTVFIAFPFRI